MPLVAAIAIRYIILAAVQLAIWSLIEKFGFPLLNKAVQELMQALGVSEETAKDIIANKLIIAFEEVGIFALTLRSKLPIKVAEYLGFTSKGFAKRKLASTVEAKIASTAISAIPTAVPTAAEVTKIAEVIGKSRGISASLVSSLFNNTLKVAGLTTAMFFALAQYIDFANWQGPYQKFFQKTIGFLGINPDTPLPKANVVPAETWKRIYATVEELNPLGLSFPFEDADRPYSRKNLADLVDSVAANMVKNQINPTYKTVIAVVLPLIQLSTASRTDADIDAIFTKLGTAQALVKGDGFTIPTTKVFTGIVSQGVVGAGLSFTPRPDDLIESADELRQAAANNLAPFLASLPGKIVYEVKIVSSIITRDGFRQSGTTQRIQTGTFSNGTPKYKTVTNKFATLVVYALTDKGSRAKLTTIILGPTDSAKLTVAQYDLRTLEGELPALVTTTDIKEISSIQTTKPIIITAPPTPTPEAPAPRAPVPEGINPLWWELNEIIKDREEFLVRRSENNYTLRRGVIIVENTNKPVPQFSTAPAVSGAVATAPKSGANATTLFEWYAAQGRELPSVAARSVVYASLRLGVEGYYTGTAEQNTKLLNALKFQAS